MPVFAGAAAQLLRQSKETPGLEHAVLFGGGALLASAFIGSRRTRRRRFPHRLSRPHCGLALGKGYPEFVKKYKQVFGESPIWGYHANACDAAVMAWKAIERVGKADTSAGLTPKGAVDRLRRMADQQQRDPKSPSISMFSASADRATLAEYREAGIDELLLRIPDTSRDEILQLLDRYIPLA